MSCLPCRPCPYPISFVLLATVYLQFWLTRSPIDNTNRGTAYILYINEADAEAAIAHMHEAQVDGAIINVSIVLPRRKFSPPPPTASRGANIDPRLPAPGRSGGRGAGGGGGNAGGGGGRGGSFGGRGGRAQRGRPARDDFDTYRPRSLSRSRTPPPAYRRGRSRSRSYDSRSPSPPRRRRRSPSYDSYRDRSRSRSRGRGYR